jgi:hypothetical protein
LCLNSCEWQFLPSLRVARWFVFKPKIQIWVKFGGSCNWRCWYILWTLGPFYGLLLYFCDIWYIVRGNLVYIFPFWYFVPRKIWQPCPASSHSRVWESSPRSERMFFCRATRKKGVAAIN